MSARRIDRNARLQLASSRLMRRQQAVLAFKSATVTCWIERANEANEKPAGFFPAGSDCSALSARLERQDN